MYWMYGRIFLLRVNLFKPEVFIAIVMLPKCEVSGEVFFKKILLHVPIQDREGVGAGAAWQSRGLAGASNVHVAPYKELQLALLGTTRLLNIMVIVRQATCLTYV